MSPLGGGTIAPEASGIVPAVKPKHRRLSDEKHVRVSRRVQKPGSCQPVTNGV